MRTEALPKEPFTLGVLLRYRTTIIVVACFVILGGYVRIVTQPPLYEAQARLAVRFPAEALALQEVSGHGGFFRLPLLEEEVKAYMMQLTDQDFISEVLRALAEEEQNQQAEPEPVQELTAADKFREKFLRTYYDIRAAILTFIDTLLLTPSAMLSQEQQQVMRILRRLEVTAGMEASHLITIAYQNRSPRAAAKVANAVASQFVKKQKSRVQKQNIAEFQAEVDEAKQDLVDCQVRLIELQTRLGSSTLELAIETRHARLELLRDRKRSLEIAKNLIQSQIMAYDEELPLASRFIVGQLEATFLNILIRYEEESKRTAEQPEFYENLAKSAEKILVQRRQLVMKRDSEIIETRLAQVNALLDEILADTTIVDVTQEYAKLKAQETIAQTRVAMAEADLAEAEDFNEQLESENVSENVSVWQLAQIPPFPMPQHRGIKLFVVVALGLFLGCSAALLQHQIRPKRVRRARPRHEGEVDVPLILLPDDSAGQKSGQVELDITFPEDEGRREGPR